MAKPTTPHCARCNIKIAERICRTKDGRQPKDCPTYHYGDTNERVLEKYKQEDFYRFAQQASLQEKDGYCNRHQGYEQVKPAKTRLEEIADFITRMNYKKIGLAFCMGLRKEAAIVANHFSSKEVEVVSAICKVGGVEKQFLDLGDEDKIVPNSDESMCNPLFQAELLNQAQTEFNVLLGLCVGHDSLFFKNSEALCTVLAVKDRVTGHNPLAAVYTLDSYYRSLKT